VGDCDDIVLCCRGAGASGSRLSANRSIATHTWGIRSGTTIQQQ